MLNESFRERGHDEFWRVMNISVNTDLTFHFFGFFFFWGGVSQFQDIFGKYLLSPVVPHPLLSPYNHTLTTQMLEIDA